AAPALVAVEPTRVTAAPSAPRELPTREVPPGERAAVARRREQGDGPPGWVRVLALGVFAVMALTLGPSLVATEGVVPEPAPARPSAPVVPTAPAPRPASPPPAAAAPARAPRTPSSMPVVSSGPEVAPSSAAAQSGESAARGHRPALGEVAAGLLVVTTTYEGFEVPSILHVDGRRVPGQTPQVLAGLRPGVHVLRLQHQDYPEELIRYPVTPRTLSAHGARLIIELSPTPAPVTPVARVSPVLFGGNLTDGRHPGKAPTLGEEERSRP
ncbi:MAG: hypothetical protein K1X89_20305, partial [Myxococcaceae bacterium]|nr:hypothetical protein [Myxococcaceae bacterium]